MRPDCTLEVEVVDAAPPLPPMRVHFDAKYKLERMEELQAADDVEDLDELIEPGAFRRRLHDRNRHSQLSDWRKALAPHGEVGLSSSRRGPKFKMSATKP